MVWCYGNIHARIILTFYNIPSIHFDLHAQFLPSSPPHYLSSFDSSALIIILLYMTALLYVIAYFNAARDALPKPDFVLLGEECDHQWCNDNKDTQFWNLQNSISEVASLLRIRWSHPTQILRDLGNIDVITDYYINLKDANNVLLDMASKAFLVRLIPQSYSVI